MLRDRAIAVAKDAILITDAGLPDLPLVDVNPAFERLTGYAPAEVLGRNCRFLQGPGTDPATVAKLREAVATGRPTAVTLLNYRKDGTSFWNELSLTPLRDAAGHVTHIVGTMSDVSEREEAVARLREAEARYRMLVERVPAVVYRQRVDDGRVTTTYVSPQVETLLGHAPSDALAEAARWLDFVHPDDRARVAAAAARTTDSGEPFRAEYRVVARDGRAVWVRDEAIAFPDEQGRPLFWHGIMQDVSERKRAELLLQQSEARFRTLVEQIQAVTYVTEVRLDETPNWRSIYVSPQVERLLGYSPAEWLLGDDDFWTALIHPEDRDRVAAEDRRTDLTAEPFSLEYRLVGRDGRVVWVREEAEAVWDEAARCWQWQGVMLDVTAQKAAETLLRQAETRFRALVERMPAIVYEERLDEVGSAITFINPQVETIVGFSPDQIVAGGIAWRDLLHPDDRDRVLAEDDRTNRTGAPFRAEYRQRTRDGGWVWLRDDAILIAGDRGSPSYWLGVQVDITERKQAEASLQRSEARFRALVQNSSDVIALLAADGTILYDSPAIERVAGYAPAELLGRDFFALLHPEDAPRLAQIFAAAVAAPGSSGAADCRLRHQDGSWRRLEAVATNLLDDPSVGGVVVNLRDVTERHELEARIVHQAFHDPLTGLPNRALFADRLARALAQVDDPACALALLFLDLDDFKVVNDSLGHTAGDRLLVAVGDRLRTLARPSDTIARLGGDEFTLLLQPVADADEADRLARRIVDLLSAPFDLDGQEVFVTPSIGLAERTPAGPTAEDLLRHADVAMYAAKRGGKAQVVRFDPAMDARARDRLGLENELRRAIKDGHLRVHYQPIVDLATDRVVEVEALVRWAHPERGLLAPADFIPLAEETGLILPLGRWLLGEAGRQVRAWQLAHPGFPPLSLAVNLSARQFGQPQLIGEIDDALAETGLPPTSLRLEITEGIAMGDVGSTLAVLRALRARGIGLALDDFGTGYSGLSYLKRWPVDTLKVDRSFVAGLGRDPDDTAIVRAVVALARTLGLRVTAEGIETAGQLADLRALACDRGQGIALSPPLPPDRFAHLLAAAHPPPPPPPTCPAPLLPTHATP